jgi:hypothetical protein
VILIKILSYVQMGVENVLKRLITRFGIKLYLIMEIVLMIVLVNSIPAILKLGLVLS